MKEGRAPLGVCFRAPWLSGRSCSVDVCHRFVAVEVIEFTSIEFILAVVVILWYAVAGGLAVTAMSQLLQGIQSRWVHQHAAMHPNGFDADESFEWPYFNSATT